MQAPPKPKVDEEKGLFDIMNFADETPQPAVTETVPPPSNSTDDLFGGLNVTSGGTDAFSTDFFATPPVSLPMDLDPMNLTATFPEVDKQPEQQQQQVSICNVNNTNNSISSNRKYNINISKRIKFNITIRITRRSK